MEEEELEQYLRALFVGREPARTILSAHVPPWNTGLDTGPDIDPHSTPDDVRQRKSLGALLTRPVGSKAVRNVIEDLQPVVSLHGHIHESRGKAKIGRCLCLNPGSDYGEGVLRGALVRLRADGLLNYQLTAG
jgi:Icc-related predicted phosphoesterase